MRGTSSLAVPTSLAIHPSFVAPPLAPLCPVCPLIQYGLYTTFALSHVAFPLAVLAVSRYFHSRYPSPTWRHPLSCDSTTGLGTRCPLTHYCLYTRYPLLRGTSSLAVTHLSCNTPPPFTAPPLAPLCPVCPLIQYCLYTTFVLSHVAFPLAVFALSRYLHSRGTSPLTVPSPTSRHPFLR